MLSKFWNPETKSARRFVFTVRDTPIPNFLYRNQKILSCSLRKVDALRYVANDSTAGINATSCVMLQLDIKLPAVESHARKAAPDVATGVKEGAQTNAETAKS